MATLFGILFINLEPSLGQFLEPSWEPFGNLLGNLLGTFLGTFWEPSWEPARKLIGNLLGTIVAIVRGTIFGSHLGIKM